MKSIFAALILVSSSSAFAYGDHAGWSNERGNSYNGSYQLINETEAIHTTMTTPDPKNNNASTSVEYKGMAMKVGMGVELAKFARFSVYEEYRDTSNNLSTSLRGPEVGGDVKLSFFGPVVNVQFGLGISGSQLVDQREGFAGTYYGSGLTGSVGLERFLAPKCSIVFTVKGEQESLTPELKDNELRPQLTTIGLGAALLLWLN